MMRAVKASDMNELTAVNDVIFIVAVKQSNDSSGLSDITVKKNMNPLAVLKKFIQSWSPCADKFILSHMIWRTGCSMKSLIIFKI